MIDQVEVDDAEIRIHGRRTVLEQLVMGGGATPAGVPSFVRKWRARQDSNLWPLPSEGSSASLYVLAGVCVNMWRSPQFVTFMLAGLWLC